MTGTSHRGFVLQDRDRHLLQELSEMRVIDREQAKCIAGFGSTTRANCRLLALTRAGLLRRFFQGTSSGGQKALYALSPTGASLVQVAYRGPRRGRDEVLIADFFVTHQLWINELYCILKYQPIPISGAKFRRWVSFTKPVEPGSSLIPDGYAEVETQEKTLAAFIEVDLGHESRSVWRSKVQAYFQFGASGNFVKNFGLPQFRVLVVTDSERRMNSLRAATAAITEKIFWFATLNEAANGNFWSPVWSRPRGDQHLSLL